MTRRLSVLALALITATGCSDTKSKTTTVIVRIVADHAPQGIDHIDLTVTRDQGVFVTPIKKAKADPQLVLPLSLKVPLPADATGNILLEAKAFDAAGTQIAAGSVEGEVLPEEVVTLELEFGQDKRLQHDGGVDVDATIPLDARMAMLSITPASQDFAQVVTGQTSMAATFLVKNDGELATGTLHVGIAGSNPAPFVIDTATPSCDGMILAAGATCSVTVTFHPSAAADATATLEVSSDPGGSVSASLTGTGVTPGDLRMTPAMHDFTSLVTGQHADLTLHVENVGGAVTGTLASMLTAATGSDLAIVTDGCAGHPLAAAASCDVVIRFAPTTVGAKSGTFTISATPGGAQMTMLMGRGIAPASVALTPTVQDFGTVVLGQSSDVTFTVSNGGGVSTGILAAALGGADAGEMSLAADTCTGHALAAGASCSITVHFTPTTRGAKAATFTVTGGPGEMIAATLTASVVTQGALAVTPASNAFGAVLQDTDSAPITLIVSNNGGAATGAITTSLSGSGTSQFSIVSNACAAPLAGNATCAIVVRYHPTTPGGKTASLVVSADPGGTSAASLSGTGLTPATLTGDASNVDFGIVDVSATSSPFVWTVRNAGDVASGPLSTTVSGDTAEFTLANTCTAGSPLAAGASCTITVRLAPTSGGAKAISIAVAGVPGGTATLAARGSGRALNLLTVARSGNGAGSVASTPAGIACPGTCSASYLFNTMVSLTATPSTGSTFTGWTGAGCSGNPCIVTLSAAQTVSAAFTLIKYPVVVAPTGMGSISAPGGIACGTTCMASYDYGSSVVLTAIPASGWSFSTWGGACAGTTPTCTVSVTGVQNVTATFTINRYALTVTTSGSGSVTSAPGGITCGATCSASFDYNTAVTLTAVPATGNHFTGWTGACTGTGSCTVTLAQAASVNAAFAIDRHTVTVSGTGTGTVSGGGISCTGTGAGCQITVDYNTPVMLTEAPGPNHHFGAWTGGCTGSATTCALTVTADVSVMASFPIDTFNLTYSATGPGTLMPSPAGSPCGAGCATYDYNTPVTLTAAPSGNNHVSAWGGACSTATGTTCALAMTVARTASVTFAIDTHNVTLTATGNGTLAQTATPAGVGCGTGCMTYPSGTTVTITASPAGNNHVSGWGGACAATLTTSSTCTVAVGAADLAASASFAVNTHNLTLTATGAGSGSFTQTATQTGVQCGTGCTTYPSGTTVTITEVPGGTSHLGAWGGACSATPASSTTCTVSIGAANVAAGASFIVNTATLTVAVTGTGTVTSTSPTGISCVAGGTSCSLTVNVGTPVTLSEAPGLNNHFGAWGGCTPSPAGNTCALTVNAASSVSASFAVNTHNLTLTATGAGSGSFTQTATQTGVQCGTGCTTYPSGTTVTITEVPGGTSHLGVWGGACSATPASSTTCTVSIGAANVAAGASFIVNTATLTVAVTGTGTVTSTSPTGISCVAGGTSCSLTVDVGTQVTLSEAPGLNNHFGAWTGCTPSPAGNTCALTVNAASSVSASFAVNTFVVTATVTGAGTISSAPGGLSCGAPGCSATFNVGQSVVLTPVSPTNYHVLWGNCATVGVGANATCTVTDTRTVTATWAIDRYTLTASTSGTGTGTLTSTSTPTQASQVVCGNGSTGCSVTYDASTVVVVSAMSNSGRFGSWTSCPGTTGTNGNYPSCTVTMSAARMVSASFIATFPLRTIVANSTGGSIVSTTPAINCTGDCTNYYDTGTIITLSGVRTNTNYLFSGWTGCPMVIAGGACQVNLTQAATVTATFTLQTGTLSVGVGVGGYIITVTNTSDNTTSYCYGGTCTYTYPYGTPLQIITSATTGYTFSSWSGVCGGQGTTCNYTVNASPISATANFSHTLYTLQVTHVDGQGGYGGAVSGSVSVASGTFSGTGSFYYNTPISLTAVNVSSGINAYDFQFWTAGPCAYNSNTPFDMRYLQPTCTFNMPAAGIMVRAQFQYVIGANDSKLRPISPATGAPTWDIPLIQDPHAIDPRRRRG